MEIAKTAFIITRLELGGAQKSVLYTAANIDKERFESFLLCGPGGYLDNSSKETIKNIFFIPSLQRAVNPIKDIRAFKEIRRALKEIQPQIIHTNSSKAGILGRFAARFYKNAKVVHTVHGFPFNDYQNPIARRFYMFLEKICAGFTDILIFVSQHDMETAFRLKIAPPQKCRLIRAGVELKTKKDFESFDKAAKLKTLGLTPENKIIVCPANLKPQKNPLDMARAADIVCKDFPQAVFLYLGTGPLEAETKALIAELNLQDNFKLLGHRNDVAELLACADIFALSSLWEGLPMALIEALSMGVPAVCYDAGGIAEVLNETNGFIAPRGYYQQLAASIMEILSGRFTFNTNAQNLAEFDIKHMLKQQEDLYQELLEKK